MHRATLVSLLVALVLASACASAPEQHDYTLVFLKTGPKSGQLSQAENQQAFAGHFANMGRLAQERKLLVAGPFGEDRHDETLRGLFVLNSSDRGEATTWASSDPAVQAGVLTLEHHDFATDAPLLSMLERDLELERKAQSEGRALKPGDGARTYVLCTAEDEDVARRELTPLMNGGGVFLLARLDGTRALAVLDAKDVADARQRFAAVLGRIGAHTLDDWFATEQLAKPHGP